MFNRTYLYRLAQNLYYFFVIILYSYYCYLVFGNIDALRPLREFSLDTLNQHNLEGNDIIAIAGDFIKNELFLADKKLDLI